VANFLVTVSSSAELSAARQEAPPADAAIEWQEVTQATEGLAHWDVEVQVGGAISVWATNTSYDNFWSFLDRAMSRLEVRPQGRVTLKSRTDPHRVVASFQYFGSHELKRCAADLRGRILALADVKSRRLTRDLEVAVHA